MQANLLGLLPEDLVAEMVGRGVRCSLREARQVLARVISEGDDDPSPRREARKAFVEALQTHTRWDRPTVVDRVTDPGDGSVRYLFRAADGLLFESVRIPLHVPGRFSVCLSSQVGCAMACDFCATGRLGLGRNLTAAEIVAQFLTVRDEAPGRVTGAVFMGQGEPFQNYEAVIQAARVLHDPNGARISADAITISTVGMVRQIRRYTAEGHPYRLVVSLTSAIQEKRARLLPVAGKTPLPELIAAVRDHAIARNTRVTLGWVLMGGVNTDDAEIEALRELVRDVPIRLNLIDVNDARPNGYVRAEGVELHAFLGGLQRLQQPLVHRYSVGRSQHSACGMLASRPAEPPLS